MVLRIFFVCSVLFPVIIGVCAAYETRISSDFHRATQIASWAQSTPSRPLETVFLNLFGRKPAESCQSNVCPKLNTEELLKLECMCSRDEFFYGMNPSHMAAVGRLTALMMAPNSAQGSLYIAEQLRDSSTVNPNVWIRSLMNTVLATPELSGLPRPSLIEAFPSMLIHSSVLTEARHQATLPQSQRTDSCILLDGTQGNINGIENVLWYWREDVMVNAHHWYWHLTHPFVPMAVQGRVPPRSDRRGELFYYVHHSMLARYHSERLSNGLAKVVPLNLEPGTIIEEPYYAYLDGTTSGQRWTDRAPNAQIQDIFFNTIADTPMNISVIQRAENLRRILESVAAGTLLTRDNQIIPLNTARGIDMLGELVEASVYSVNPNYYGGFGVHNDGHFLLALIQDARGEQRLPPGVMGDASTAMRDPAFYRFHVPIADIFDQHKHYLIPYHPAQGEFPLQWDGVTVSNVQVISGNQKVNDLTTFWNHAMYDISRGLDFNRSLTQGQGPINVCIQHLDHEPFEYQINIVRESSVSSNSASVRIFMAPKFDENGQPYTLYHQRDLFFVLDYFPVQLNLGNNVIRRSSLHSSLTTSWPQRLEELERNNVNQRPDCGCGWPQHLLIPKGTQQGMIFDLFVMVTNGEEDAVRNQAESGQAPPTCRAAPIYCGLPGQLYPDSKPMGYPFDRLPYSIQEPSTDSSGNLFYSSKSRMVSTIDEYVRGVSNTATTQIRITHLTS